MGKGSGGNIPNPDYSAVKEGFSESSAFARQNAEQQMAWAREQFASNKELMERVLDTQLPIMQQNAEFGQGLQDRYQEVFQPIEDALVKDANEYASGARSEFEAGRAIADVGQAFDAARSNALARMESYGVDPSQTRSAALDAGVRVQEAAAKAAAGTQSRLNTEATGRALQKDMVGVGQNTLDNSQKATATALGAGQYGMSNALGTTQSGANTMGTGVQWSGQNNTALGGLNTATKNEFDGQMQKMNAENAASQQQGQAIGSTIGTIAGAAMMFMADGGEVPHDPADPVGKADTFDAKLSGGEFVIPASAVRRLGSDHFDKLIARYGDEEDRQAAIQRMRTGAPGGEPVPSGPGPATQQMAIQRVGSGA